MLKYLFIAFLFIHSSAYSASFDCNLAKTEIEKFICKDSILSELDVQMSKVYSIVVKKYGSNALALQRFWISNIRNKSNISSLKYTYSSRIVDLLEIEQGNQVVARLRILKIEQGYDENSRFDAKVTAIRLDGHNSGDFFYISAEANARYWDLLQKRINKDVVIAYSDGNWIQSVGVALDQ